MKGIVAAVLFALGMIVLLSCDDPESTTTGAATATATPPPASTPRPMVTVEAMPTLTSAPAPSPTPAATIVQATIPSPAPTAARTATVGPTVAPEPSLTADAAPMVGRADEGIEWEVCGPAVECGFVEVPSDYRDPGAGSIRIAVNVRRATSPDDRVGYLFVNPGGPGDSGVNFVRDYYAEIFTREVRERFDVVGFDPRGVGTSEPEFACGASGEQLSLLSEIELPVDTPEEIAAGEAAAYLCIQSMGPDGALLHSEYVARDMDEIRKALGAEDITYLGFSYGSALGVWYATLFPKSVRAMVVDGADNPVDQAENQEERIEEALEEIGPFAVLLREALEACDEPECPIYNDGDPIGYFLEASEKLDLVSQELANHPLAGLYGVLTTLYSQDFWRYLWLGLYLLQENDDPSLLTNFASAQYGEDPGAARFVAYVNCLDGWVLEPELERETQLEESDIVDAIIEERFPLLAAMVFSAPSACPFYDQFAPAALGVPLDGGDVPILVIGNHSDPATSFGESEELVEETLSNGYLVEVSHPSHTVYPDNGCVNEYVHRVLIEREYPSGRRVDCERDG